MKKINSARDLQKTIAELEIKKMDQESDIKLQMADMYENLKPINIVRNTLHDAFSSGSTKSNIINSVIGLGSGLISKKLLIGQSSNVLRKVLGTALQLGITGFIAKNADKIKTGGSELINKLFNKRKKNYPKVILDDGE